MTDMQWLFLVAQEEGPKPGVAGIFAEGNFVPFLLVVAFTVVVYIMIQRARAGLPIPEIRKIAGLEALDEAIGRATEMGRPVFFFPGLAGVTGSYGAATIASFAMLGHVAKRAAQYDTRLIDANVDPYVHPIAEEIIRQAYLEAGRPDAFNPDDVRFLSPEQFAATAAILGIFRREKPAANILFGAFWAESMILAENGAQIGAIQIGATATTHQMPFFVAACDYALIGEEMYAASAYVSKEPVLTGTVVGQDWARIATFALIVVGTILIQFGNETIKSILGK